VDLKRMVSIYLHISTIYSVKAAHSNNYTSMITSRISNTKEKKNTGAAEKEQPIKPHSIKWHIYLRSPSSKPGQQDTRCIKRGDKLKQGRA
jgi:hypothetical protein